MANLDLLFAVADKLAISDAEKQKVNEMLHPNGETLFLVKSLDNAFWFDCPNQEEIPNIVFDGKTLMIPAECVETGMKIRITVTENGTDTVYEDWKVDKVDRKKTTDVSQFVSVWKSDSIKKQSYEQVSKVRIDIVPAEGIERLQTMAYSFKVIKGKQFKVIDQYSFELE